MNNKQSIRMSIVYDNNSLDEKLKPDWGFSCLIRGLEKSILFDAGGKGKVLLSNMEKLGIHPSAIDLVILSHEHRDHTGGLEALLKENPHLEVWIPEFFSSRFKKAVKKKGATLVEVEKFQQICEGAYTTGVIQGWINEQSLILDTDKGLIVMTGCAHPRIIKIISKARELLKKDVYLTLGGFHLLGFPKNEIEEIIETFRAEGVKKVGPCHCSGVEARQLFAKEYEDDFLDIGAGKEIEIL